MCMPILFRGTAVCLVDAALRSQRPKFHLICSMRRDLPRSRYMYILKHWLIDHILFDYNTQENNCTPMRYLQLAGASSSLHLRIRIHCRVWLGYKEKVKGKLGAYAMKRVATRRSTPDSLAFWRLRNAQTIEPTTAYAGVGPIKTYLRTWCLIPDHVLMYKYERG